MTLRLLPAAALVALSPLLLAACGDDGGSSNADTGRVEEVVDGVVGDNDVELKGNSELDAAAYGIVAVQSEKYADYEIDGDRVLLKVRGDAELSGSECIIVTAATEVDHPDVAFVLVEPDGTETVC